MIVGDEALDLNGLTDSPSADFIDQFVIGAANQASSLYTFSLPTVANFSGTGNEALTNSSYSVSEGQLTLSTNGEYLVTGGYNDTVSAWSPQQTFSPASTINRVIGTISGTGVINTTTDLTDAYSGDNFRGVVSTDGTQFFTVGHASGFTPINDFVHYATLGATTSTILTGPSDPSNINKVEIFNGQLYEAARNGGNSPNAIYQVGTGLPTTGGQPQTLFIETPTIQPARRQRLRTSPWSPSISSWLICRATRTPSMASTSAYVADAQMGIARYDYEGATLGWQFSYFIDSTGSFNDNAYSVSSMANQTGTEGDVTATSNFNPNDPAASADPSKAGGVRGLTGRVVTVRSAGVQLFGTTGFGTTAQPNPGESLIEVTDPASLTVPSNGLKMPDNTNMLDTYTTLATDPLSSKSELTGVAFTPTQTVTSQITVVGTPAANAQSVTTAENMAHAVTLTGSDPNSPALPLTYTVTVGPTHGMLSGSGPNLTYTPTAGYFGSDSFQFTDSNGTATSAAATVSITVVGTPAANAQSVTTAENMAHAVTLTGSDPNSPALPLTYTVTVGPTHGMLSGSGPNLTYTPTAGYFGSDSFQFTDSNGTATSAAATVSITVVGTPAANAQSVTTAENMAHAVTLTGSDPNSPALPLTYTVTVGPTYGLLSGTGANLTYTPTAGYFGADSFQFTDSNGTATSAAAMVSITVVGTPAANAQSVATAENMAQTVTLTGSDPNSPPLSLTYTVTVGPSHGMLSGTGANRTYTPNAGYFGSDSFQFTDSNGTATSAVATVSITVEGPGATQFGNALYLIGGNTNDQLNITPIGAHQDGSTGINVNGQLNGVNINNKAYMGITTVYVVGYGGNDNFQFAGSLTIATVVSDGNGNDQIQLDNGANNVTLGNGNDNVQPGGGGTQGGNGNNTITAGNGNDQIQLGNGNNVVVAGTGNDNIKAGDGKNTVMAGAIGSMGNIQLQLGNGANNVVTLLGNGNDQVQAGNGAGDIVTITGNGNDQVKLGDGAGDMAAITDTGNGSDQVQVGNGTGDHVSILGNGTGNDQVVVGNGTSDSVAIVGTGNENVQTGDGSGTVHVTSTLKNVHLGSSGWTQI